MMKLIKYELIRKKKLYIATLYVFTALTILAATGLPKMDNDHFWFILVIVSSAIIFAGGVFLPVIINAANYYNDYKKTNGYMMFLTPSSGAKIFGSKILCAAIDTLGSFIYISLFILALCCAANVNIFIDAPIFLTDIYSLFPGFSITMVILLLCIALFLQVIGTIVLAMFSITLSKTMLSHRSINWFIPLVIFLGLLLLELYLSALIITGSNSYITGELYFNMFTINGPLVYAITTAISLIFIAAYTASSSALINKKLDL